MASRHLKSTRRPRLPSASTTVARWSRSRTRLRRRVSRYGRCTGLRKPVRFLRRNLSPHLQDDAASRNLLLVRRSNNADRYSAGSAAVALASLSAFLFALVLIAAPGLHAHFHEDAGHPQHECAITVVEAGTEAGDAAPLATPPQPASHFATVPALKSVWVAAPFLNACIFEHAPPALS